MYFLSLISSQHLWTDIAQPQEGQDAIRPTTQEDQTVRQYPKSTVICQWGARKHGRTRILADNPPKNEFEVRTQSKILKKPKITAHKIKLRHLISKKKG